MENRKKSSDFFLQLPTGKVEMKQRSFAFHLQQELTLPRDETRCLLLITGDNGTGKTSFLELVIIPWLLKNNITFQFIGQDCQIQGIVERSLDAILGITNEHKNLLAQILLNRHLDNPPDEQQPKLIVEGILLDETDKLLSSEQLRETLCSPLYRFVIMISHNLEKQEIGEHRQCFDIVRNLNISGHTAIRQVEINLW